jgi:hypothetical protein
MADQRIWQPNLYSEGSCIYEVDEKGNIVELVAWARNTLAASAAFEELCGRNSKTRYQQRRRGHVENERISVY